MMAWDFFFFKGKKYYLVIFALIVTGSFFLIFLRSNYEIDDFIIALYIVEFQIVIVQGLAFYKDYSRHYATRDRLADLRFKLIRGEIWDSRDFSVLHDKIIKKHNQI